MTDPIRQRPQGQSVSLGAADPRGRRANAGSTAAAAALQDRLNGLERLSGNEDLQEVRLRVNEIIDILKGGL